VEVLPTGQQSVLMRYPDIRMYGFDLAKNVGKYGVRIEGSSVQPDEEGSTVGTMQPYHYMVVGVDRTLFGDFNINLQLYIRENKPEDAGPPSTVSYINGLIFAQSHQTTNGITLRLANQWRNQTVSAEIFVQHYFSDGSTYLHPMISYAVTDEIKWTLGAAWYFGDNGTLFGVMEKNNNIFSELRFSF